MNTNKGGFGSVGRLMRQACEISEHYRRGMKLRKYSVNLAPLWAQPVTFRRRLFHAMKHPAAYRKMGNEIWGTRESKAWASITPPQAGQPHESAKVRAFDWRE